jgi:NAD(P)-dependent dehydrogenase (short-subunit alcohol dehydrogenase family)
MHLFAVDHLVNNASIWQVCQFEEMEDVNHFRTLMVYEQQRTHRLPDGVSAFGKLNLRLLCILCIDQDINFWGHVYPTRLAIPHLKKTHGRIVGVTSNSSYIFIGRNTFYNVRSARLNATSAYTNSNTASE